MSRSTLRSLLALVLLAGPAVASAVATTTTSGRLGTVVLEAPAGVPRDLVLLLGGEPGWSSGETALVRALAARGTLTARIEVTGFGRSLQVSRDGCIFMSGDLERFAHDLERRYRFPAYVNPVLVGTGTGAALAYASLVQAPVGTFRGAVSIGFCPSLPWSKPLCRGDGPGLDSRGTPIELQPARALKDPWSILQLTSPPGCATEARAFSQRVPGTRFVEVSPALAAGTDVRAVLTEIDRFATQAAPLGSPAPADVSDLQLVEVPATSPGSNMFAVMLSGDGGWAGLDREVAAVLARRGVPVVGWDSLRYFWRARTPESAARDLARIIEHYQRHWGKARVLAIGYSLGADTMPFIVNRLPADARDRVALTALLAPGRRAFFEFHVSLWVGLERGGLPLAPELQRLAGSNLLCVYGADEPDSACADIRDAGREVLLLPGGHHFDGNYPLLAQRILGAVGER